MVSIDVRTTKREEQVDITGQVASALAASGLSEGAVLVYCPHTTAGLFINEGADPDVARDFWDCLAGLVPRDGPYRHAEGNSAAHIRAVLVGNSVTIPVSGGRLALGTWQHVFLAEFDGPRERRLRMQFLRG